MESPLPGVRDFTGPERLTYDSLTGLRNEHLFRLQLPTEFARARARDGEANGAMIAIKLDNILAINAQHGRSGGDEALRAVAYILENFRSSGKRRATSCSNSAAPCSATTFPPAARQRRARRQRRCGTG